KRLLALASRTLAQSVQLEAPDGTAGQRRLEALIEEAALRAGAEGEWVLAVTDPRLVVTAVSPRGGEMRGRALDEIAEGGQPLFLFGERAGALPVRIGDADWLAAVSLLPDGRAAVALADQDMVFSDWRGAVSLNVTLFVLMASVLMAILYAYFSQAARAAAADRLYREAHQRVDMALVRGKCGLWDWDL